MSGGYFRSLLVSAVTLVLLASFYISSIQSPSLLSPQGCRMSWMLPSYILQREFNATWTRLSRRYSLWLYREVDWDSPDELTGVPVLFIPGNSGSSRQVRSIASSATKQYFLNPRRPHPDFTSRGIKQLDFFTVDFNEDFSALHGPTLLSERSYTSAAIKYILSLYPPRTKIILMGHSMGGIVALSLLPSSDISAIITMSTPHSLPPARLDRRIEDIYSDSWDALRNQSTPVLSLCGGATDLMIPSETCSMEKSGSTVGWRKTVFTTCMEGTWTGVGHQEMVWCHQVRWRVARAALELGIASNDDERGTILDRWLRDGVDNIPDAAVLIPDNVTTTYISPGQRLILREPPRDMHMYMLPLHPGPETVRLTLYVSRGSVGSMSPHHSSDLKVSVHRCHSSHQDCQLFQPSILKLIPRPLWETQFPAQREGVDESDGVVFFESAVDLTTIRDGEQEWIGVTVQGEGDRRSWVVAGMDRELSVQSDASKLVPFLSKIVIPLDPTVLLTKIRVPNVLSNSLVVYRVAQPTVAGSCSDVLLPPLLLHTSGLTESHFHPMDGMRPLLLHSHSHGPFINSWTQDTHGFNLTVHSSGECGITRLEVSVDWWGSLGRWALRYWTTVCAWAVGVVGVMIFQAWNAWEKGGVFPTPPVSLGRYTSRALIPLSGTLLLVSLLPLGSTLLLGNSGEPIFAPLAPLILFTASGCVALSWHFVQSVMWLLSRFSRFFGSIPDETRSWRRNILSLGIILVLIATVIPSQVAFLACFLIHLFTCAVQYPTPATSPTHVEAHAQKSHILLLLFWLLPLVAPVLAVWVRTLATAGLTTPFDGDHDVFAIVSFLFFVEVASSSAVPLFTRASSRLYRQFTTGVLLSLAIIPFAFGGRYTYRIYFISNFTMGYLVVTQVIDRWRLRVSSAAVQ